jgi:hypothetical protein
MSYSGESFAVRGERVHRLIKRLCLRWCFFGPRYEGLLSLLPPAGLPRWWRSQLVICTGNSKAFGVIYFFLGCYVQMYQGMCLALSSMGLCVL